MLEITILIEESELLDIINKKLSQRIQDNEVAIISKFLSTIIKDQSATFFYGPTNLDKWLDETLSRLTIIVPNDPEYDHWLHLWESQDYEEKNYVVQEKLGNQLLLEEL